jgi:hypothetical protein
VILQAGSVGKAVLYSCHAAFSSTTYFVKEKSERKSSKMSYSSNAYGYQRPNTMAYGLPDQGMMGSAGVYGGAPVVSFPGPPAAPIASQPKPYYRCWDNTHKKWFYWEKDSSSTTWTEPPAHITVIDHETGSIVQRDQPVVPSRPAQIVPETSTANPTSSFSNNRASAPNQSSQGTVSSSSTTVGSSVKATQQTRFQPSLSGTINPNYSAGVSRYTQPGSSVQSGVSAAEKARIEEADRLIAEQLQKQLSLEAEAELVAACPLPGEAAKMVANQKKKFNFSKPSSKAEKANDEEEIADMAKHGFVVKKQKPKKGSVAGAK